MFLKSNPNFKGFMERQSGDTMILEKRENTKIVSFTSLPNPWTMATNIINPENFY